ncbi:MAG: hypothetical protein Q7S20_05885 [Gemmatimonadaceae bacterium]|nr:hypothetical protein [Gemmatimonadaceae bacterium]
MDWVIKLANIARSRFDSFARRIGPLGVVGILAILNAIVVAAMGWLEQRKCGELPVRIIDIELTFSAHRFSTLLGLIRSDECRAFVQWNFLTLDVLFPIAYALGLCAVFLWMERQRRFNADGSPTGVPLPFRNHLFVLGPLAAGAVDIFFENVPLWLGATLLGRGWTADSLFIAGLVCIGSLGAAIKWALVLMSALAILGELLSCSRGTVLRRLRFSVIAVVLGSLPLLLIAQGQDILQRVVEGDSPTRRIIGALLALTFAAQTVWYCGRKLVQLRFAGDPDPQDGNWYEFFAEHIPRMLGIAVLALGGAAFARAGAALGLFTAATLAGYLVTFAANRWWPALPRLVGRLFVHGYWKIIAHFDEQIGRAVIAGLLAFVILIPPWRYDSVPRDFLLLRVTAWLLLVVAWGFYLYVYSRRGRIAARNAKRRILPIVRERLPKLAASGSLDLKKDVFAYEVRHVEAEAVASVDANALGRAIKRGVLTGLLASVIAVAVFTFWPVESARGLGSLVILAMAASSVVFYGSIAAWVYGKYRVPVVPIAIAFAVLFSVWNENHVIRKLNTGREMVADRPDIATRLSQWRAADSSQTPSPVILVAAAGGGLRAAYWTATSLAAIQNRNHSFNRHVFAISGVSGGSLGAAVYAAIVRGDSTPPPGSSSRTMHDSRDLLDILQSDLPLSTAVHNSARFTYVSPPGRIQRSDSAEYGHLVDGGYFENSGLATLREVLDVIMQNRAATGGSPRLKPIVLYLCNDPVSCRDGGAGDTVLTTRHSAVVEWFGPIRALLGTRDARGSLARADIADVDSVHFIQLNVCESLLADDSSNPDSAELLGSSERRQRAKERIVSPPLGWLLSKVARDWMDASLTAGDGKARPSRCRRSNEHAIQKIDSLLRLH